MFYILSHYPLKNFKSNINTNEKSEDYDCNAQAVNLATYV
jgi:hypothetical protein